MKHLILGRLAPMTLDFGKSHYLFFVGLILFSPFAYQQVSGLWNETATPESASDPAETNISENQAGDKKIEVDGKIIDSHLCEPISGATIYCSGTVVRSRTDGTFHLNVTDTRNPLMIKAPGYRQTSLISLSENMLVELEPIETRGLYLTHYGIGSKLLRGKALELINSTELNAVVIDVKGDRGFLSSRYDVPLASQIGATKLITVKDMPALIEKLHQQDIYVIGRIVVFKDDILAHAMPELAIHDTKTGAPWIDNEDLAWIDPFQEEAWHYYIAIAVEAAKIGFDEIQYDYIRFPTDGRLSTAQYSQPNTMENRVRTINKLLEVTQQALLPYNVYFSVDLFGYTPWNYNDTDIGQNIEDVANYVDYICLMLYPSGYHLGIPGYLQPVAHPFEIVYYTLEKAKKRLGGQAKKLKPWLQNFRDYAFDRRLYTGDEIRLQIEACQQAATSGYLLWDPSNYYKYTADAMSALKANNHLPEPIDEMRRSAF